MKVVKWRVNEDDEKIILTLLDDDLKTIEGELPKDIFEELVAEGPPTEGKRIRDLIDKIHEIREKRVMTISKLDKDLDNLNGEEKKAREGLEKAEDKLEVQKYSAILRSIAGERANLSQRRHLIRLLYQEEGALSKKLVDMM